MLCGAWSGSGNAGHAAATESSWSSTRCIVARGRSRSAAKGPILRVPHTCWLVGFGGAELQIPSGLIRGGEGESTTRHRSPRSARARQRPGAAAGGSVVTSQEPRLPCRIRLVDGRWFSGELPAARHRALQLGLLHAGSDGLIEIAAGFRRDGNCDQPRRDPPIPARRQGRNEGWLEDLLAAAERHAAPRRRGVRRAARASPRGRGQAGGHPHTGAVG